MNTTRSLRSNSRYAPFLCALFLLLGAIGMRAQTTGQGALEGTVLDPAGAVVADAGPVHALALAPNNTQFLTAGADKAIKLWNVNNGALERSIPTAGAPRLSRAAPSVRPWAANVLT